MKMLRVCASPLKQHVTSLGGVDGKERKTATPLGPPLLPPPHALTLAARICMAPEGTSATAFNVIQMCQFWLFWPRGVRLMIISSLDPPRMCA